MAVSPFDIYKNVVEHTSVLNSSSIPAESFLLKICNDEFVDENINKNDYLLINPTIKTSNGNIILITYNDKIYLRKFFKEDETIKLISESKSIDQISIKYGSTGYKIIGVVVGLYRKMSS